MIADLKRSIDSKYQGWLDRRLGTSSSVILTQRRIFIFPGRVGLFYLSLIALTFLTAINYQNNLLFSFSCLLVGVFVSAIAFTYQNLSGLKIAAGACESVFTGEKISANVVLSTKEGSEKEGVFLGFSRNVDNQLDTVSGELVSTLTFIAKDRGPIKVPKFTVFSHYPLGLLRCWTWVSLEFEAVVYPKPVFQPFKKVTSSDDDDFDETETPNLVKGQSADDFYGFRQYHAGDSLKHIAWRQYAKTSQLLTKEFSSYQGVSRWLDWNSLSGVGVELRLQILCGWVLTAHDHNDEYGLILPGEMIALNSGESHKRQCLTALAMFGFQTRGNTGGADAN